MYCFPPVLTNRCIKTATKYHLSRRLLHPPAYTWCSGYRIKPIQLGQHSGEQGRKQQVISSLSNQCSLNLTILLSPILELCCSQQRRKGCATEMLLLGPTHSSQRTARTQTQSRYLRCKTCAFFQLHNVPSSDKTPATTKYHDRIRYIRMKPNHMAEPP